MGYNHNEIEKNGKNIGKKMKHLKQMFMIFQNLNFMH